MNFVEAFKEGKKGKKIGLPMGEGLRKVSEAIGGIQKSRSYVVGAAPKVGKTTVVDYGWVIEPAIYVLDNNAKFTKKIAEIEQELSEETDIDTRGSLNKEYSRLKSKLLWFEIIYLSYEIDRVAKEFDFAAHFLYRDYGIEIVRLPEGKTHKGKNYVQISSQYLAGELSYDRPKNSSHRTPLEAIIVNENIENKLKKVYKNRIVPLFGEYNSKGKRVKKGLIDFVEYKDNPTGIRNSLLEYADKKGKFIYSVHKTKNKQTKRIIGYKPKNPELTTLVVTDHVRKLIPERQFNLKQTVDKYSEYTVELRNFCKFSFVHIVHLNRSMSDVQRRKLDGDRVYPTSDDIKETGTKKHYYVFICLVSSNVVLLLKIYVMNVNIYGLYDPRNSKIRYIGRTKRELRIRLNEHVCNARKKRKNKYLYTWINSLLKIGIRPKIKLLTTVENWKKSHLVEREIINKFKDKHNLVNSEDRGEGGLNKIVSKETRNKLKKSLKKYYNIEENKSNFYNKIYCYDKEGDLYKEYKSSFFACKELNIKNTQLANHINRFDNYNKKVNPINGYYFSKCKYVKYPITKKYQSNHVSLTVFCKRNKKEFYFKNLKLFANFYNLSDWDISQYRKGKKTNRFKKLFKQIEIK